MREWQLPMSFLPAGAVHWHGCFSGQPSRIFLFLSSTACAKERSRKSGLHLDARFLKSSLTLRKEQKRQHGHWGQKTKSFHKCNWVCLHVLEFKSLKICGGRTIRRQIVQAKSHRSNIPKMARCFLLYPTNCTAWEYILKIWSCFKPLKYFPVSK